MDQRMWVGNVVRLHFRVEASFMMMNQVDSRSFDDDKDDDKKPKE